MRNWFILFTTTFTITTLVITIASKYIHAMPQFNSRYVVLITIISVLLSLFIHLTNRLQRENMYFTVITDITFIFTIVFSGEVIIGIHEVRVSNIILTLSLVTFIYTIISLIYFFLLRKEAEGMNKKISEWRTKHVDS